jgi:hypothetical protein
MTTCCQLSLHVEPPPYRENSDMGAKSESKLRSLTREEDARHGGLERSEESRTQPLGRYSHYDD